MSSLGPGTMVSDALSIMIAEYSSTSFRVSRVEIGRQNFLGNNIAHPPRAKVGANYLLVTKVLAAKRRYNTAIYQPYFWWHERLWKLLARPLFNGTPFKNVMWRLLGVRIGRRVFDDGCGIPEKTLVTIGDDCTLNAGSIIQCHSLEEGTFKSDRTVLGSGCTIGVESFVHYGAAMGDGSVLSADAFLMKGEEVPSNAYWQGNPAREIRRSCSA